MYSFTLAVCIAGNGIGCTGQCQSSVLDSDHSVSSRGLINRFQAPFFRLEGKIAILKRASIAGPGQGHGGLDRHFSRTIDDGRADGRAQCSGDH